MYFIYSPLLLTTSMSTSKLLQRKLARDCELEFRVYSFRAFYESQRANSPY